MLWIGGRKDERRLREVQFARNLLHGCGVESDRIGKYRERLPSKATVVKTSTFTNPYERGMNQNFRGVVSRPSEAPAMDVSALVTPTGVSRLVYIDEEIYRTELDRIFGTTWVYVAHESEIPKPGDYKTTHIGETPVIATREASGALAVLVNRCTHRGALVCQYRKGNSPFFRCQYHGWTFDNGGALTGVPHPQGGPTSIAMRLVSCAWRASRAIAVSFSRASRRKVKR